MSEGSTPSAARPTRLTRNRIVALTAAAVFSIALAGCRSAPTARTSTPTTPTSHTTANTPTPTATAQDRLKAMLPAGFQCDIDGGGYADQRKSIARAVCKEGAIAQVVYWLFPDSATLAAGFNTPPRADLNESLVACPGRGQSPQDWHSTAKPQLQGKLSCVVGQGSGGPKSGTYPHVRWTVDSQLILGSVGGDKVHTLDQLYQWWSAQYR